MKKIFYSLAVASLLFVSCKKENQSEENNSEVFTDSTSVVGTTSATTIAPVEPNAMGTNPNSIMNQPSNGISNQSTTVQVPQPVKVGAGMNPSHGQPGHRCDIAVGAPLNSASGKANIIPQQSQPAVMGNSAITTTPQPNQPTVVTAEGMNPPHGQEGHKCEVPVGAPLPKV